MEPTPKRFPRLADVECEVAAEGREWTRQRLQERLQQLADQHREVFPLRQRRRRKLTLRSEFGDVKLAVDYGQHPQSLAWSCPLREAWGLGPHQKLTPGLAQKLCFTVTATGCYQEAAAVASKWGVAVDDSTLHALVQRMGARAEGQTQERLATPPAEREPQRAASPLAVLLVEGWQVRQRGEGWGKKKTAQPRVEWHEL